MPALQTAKQQILKELKKAVGREFSPSLADLSFPPDPKMGDIAFACFGLAKALKKNPADLAHELAAKIGPKLLIKKIEAAGPYVNFTLDDAKFGVEVFAHLHPEGDLKHPLPVGEKAKVMVEFAQPNTHKEIHVGHLRNFFLGQAIVNVLKANGFQVIPTSYINDLGMHVATVLWQDGEESHETPPHDKIAYLGEMYAKATRRMEEDPTRKTQVAAIFQDLENRKGSYLKRWKETRKWSLKYIEGVFKELGLTIDQWYYESDLVDETRRLIEGMIKKGIVRHSEGAWIVDLSEEKLGVNLLLKSDKTLLYNAKDLALALRKEKDHHPRRSLYVIDARQSLAMKQLFATLARTGFKKELAHLSYEFVTLKDGAMASRRGNIIRYELFRDAMVDLAQKETAARHKDWSERKITKTARAIAGAAMRYGMVKQDAEKKIVFDMQEAMSFDGNTGPYLLYSLARIRSLLRKAKMRSVRTFTHQPEPVEHRLLLQIARYSDIVFAAGQKLQVAPLAQYLFDLSKMFAEFYEQVPVLKAPKEVAAERLALAGAVGQILESGLALLGIESVEEM